MSVRQRLAVQRDEKARKLRLGLTVLGVLLSATAYVVDFRVGSIGDSVATYSDGIEKAANLRVAGRNV